MVVADMGRGGATDSSFVAKMLLVALIGLLVLSMCLVHLGIQARINEEAARVRELRRGLEVAANRHQQLLYELSSLHSTERIERIAVGQLGMARPEQVVHLDPGVR